MNKVLYGRTADREMPYSKEDSKLRRISRRIITACIVIAVLMMMSAAAVYAYFTDYEDAHGGAILELHGETEIKEKPEDDKKTVTIRNTGETDVIVRAAIYGDNLTETADEKDWVKDGDYWYYLHILKPGEETSEIVAEIDVKAAKEAGHDFDIVVVQESERVSYDGTPENKVVKPEGWAYPDIEAGGGEVSD